MQFSLFKKFKVDFIDEKIFVHRITCNGNKGFDRKVMYPFITQNNSKKGYYVFEGAIYILEYIKMNDLYIIKLKFGFK